MAAFCVRVYDFDLCAQEFFTRRRVLVTNKFGGFDAVEDTASGGTVGVIFATLM